MSYLDKTLQMIPINKIQQILFDGTWFQRFARFDLNKDFFGDIELEAYLQSLNQYMDYVIRHESYLPRDIFDRINYLNSLNNNNKKYDYETYLNFTQELIPISLIEKILIDQKTFEKFMDFENNKMFFNESLESYIVRINEMVDYYRKNAIELPKTQLDNYNTIMEKYSMNNQKINIYQPINELNLGELDSKFKKKIMKKVNLNWDSLTKARAIYIELAKTLTYSNEYLLGNDDVKQEIKNSSMSDVTLQNNSVVCITWSQIYATLLKEIGINSTLVTSPKGHMFVEFDNNGFKVKADATNITRNANENFSMCDMFRVKLGINTSGFTSNNKNINISEIDNKIKYYNKELLSEHQIIKEYESKRGFFETVSLEDKAEIMKSSIDRLKNNKKLRSFEIPQYLSALSFNLNDSGRKDIAVTYAFTKDKKGDCVCSIVSICNGETYDYYFQKQGKFEKLNCLDLDEYLNSGFIKLYNKSIPGIQSERENYGFTK